MPARVIAAAALRAGEHGPEAGALLRQALAKRLEAGTVALIGSARLGLHQLFSRVAARHPCAEVILWGCNFFAVPDMARLCGLTPVFADAADTTGEPSVEVVERLVGPRTRALVVSHHYGRPSSMDRWTALAERHGLALVEDCAHAFGATFGGRSVGLFGEGGVFSLSITKGLTGISGGLLVTPRRDRAIEAWEATLPMPTAMDVRRTLLSALLGKVLLTPSTYAALVHAPNRLGAALGVDLIDRVMAEPPAPPPPLDALTIGLAPAYARVALAHLPSVDAEIAARREATRAIVSARPWRALELPPLEDDRLATSLILPVRAEDPERLRRHLLAAGFDSRRDYLRPMGDERALPVAHRLFRQGVYLPVRGLSAAGVGRLVDVLAAFDDAAQPMRIHGSAGSGTR